MQANFSGQFQKIARISASHIGDAAQLPLSPKQAIVVKFGHAIQMNCIDRHNSTFADARQGSNHHIATWCKSYGPIQFHWRLLSRAANPSRTKRFGKFSMRFAPSGYVHFTAPGTEYGDRQMRRRTKTK